MAMTVLFGVFTLLLLIGTPVAFCLGIASVATVLYMGLPPIVVTLPLFPVVDWLGLSDTHAVLILLYSAFWVSLFTMIMKTAIDEVMTVSTIISGPTE